MLALNRDHFLLASGRVFYAFGLTLSLTPAQTLCYGSDGAVTEFDPFYGHTPLTPAERHDIAAYVIAQWQAWQAQEP